MFSTQPIRNIVHTETVQSPADNITSRNISQYGDRSVPKILILSIEFNSYVSVNTDPDYNIGGAAGTEYQFFVVPEAQTIKTFLLPGTDTSTNFWIHVFSAMSFSFTIMEARDVMHIQANPFLRPSVIPLAGDEHIEVHDNLTASTAFHINLSDMVANTKDQPSIFLLSPLRDLFISVNDTAAYAITNTNFQMFLGYTAVSCTAISVPGRADTDDDLYLHVYSESTSPVNRIAITRLTDKSIGLLDFFKS